MDSERQPLLAPTVSELRSRRFRPLSYEEVLASRRQLPWTRARLALIFMFWAAMALFLSIIVAMLVNPDCSKDFGSIPSVPPAHISFAPLVS